MPLRVNIRHLTRQNALLEGQLSAAELDLEIHDEMIQARQPLHYDLEVQLLDDSLLVRGSLCLTLDCECVRCLKLFPYRLELTDWADEMPLKGDDKVPVVDDSVDLTGVLREDILLAFPAHPVCDSRCAGLIGTKPGVPSNKESRPAELQPSPWTELDKLKFRN